MANTAAASTTSSAASYRFQLKDSHRTRRHYAKPPMMSDKEPLVKGHPLIAEAAFFITQNGYVSAAQRLDVASISQRFYDQFFRRTGDERWEYSDEGMVSLLNCFRSMSDRSLSRHIFDLLDLDKVTIAAGYRHSLPGLETAWAPSEMLFDYFEMWMRRPAQLLYIAPCPSTNLRVLVRVLPTVRQPAAYRHVLSAANRHPSWRKDLLLGTVRDAIIQYLTDAQAYSFRLEIPNITGGPQHASGE